MLAPTVMRHLPFRINDRPFSHLDDTVAGSKAHLSRSDDKFNVRPLVTVIVDIIRDLAQKDTFIG
jgi:hypothetical protein